MPSKRDVPATRETRDPLQVGLSRTPNWDLWSGNTCQDIFPQNGALHTPNPWTDPAWLALPWKAIPSLVIAHEARPCCLPTCCLFVWCVVLSLSDASYTKYRFDPVRGGEATRELY